MEHKAVAYKRNGILLINFTANECIFEQMSIFFNTDDDRTKISFSNAVTRCLELNLAKNERHRHKKINRRLKTRKQEISNMAVCLIQEDATKTR